MSMPVTFAKRVGRLEFFWWEDSCWKRVDPYYDEVWNVSLGHLELIWFKKDFDYDQYFAR